MYTTHICMNLVGIFVKEQVPVPTPCDPIKRGFNNVYIGDAAQGLLIRAETVTAHTHT